LGRYHVESPRDRRSSGATSRAAAFTALGRFDERWHVRLQRIRVKLSYSQSRGDSLEECRAYYPHQDFVHSSCRHRSAITFNRMSVVDKAKQYAVYRCDLQERSAQVVHTALYERSHFVRFRSFHRLQPICDCTRHLHWPEMPKILDLELMEGDVLRLHSQWLARARSKRSKRQKPYGRVAAPSKASRLEN
jgi:hypothetical protein